MKVQILILKSFLIGFLSLICSFSSNAQFYEVANYIKEAATARDHITQLHNGTLVMRLRSKSRNIEAMQATLDSDKLKPNQRKRLSKQLNALISESKKENSSLAAALKEHYSFSEYRIISDTATHLLFNNKESGYFLNEQLEIDPNQTIDFSKPVYIIKYGPTNISQNSRHEALVITDLENKELASPFPYISKTIWPFLAPINSFFGNTSQTPRFSKMIERTNKSLNKFYLNSEIKREKDLLRQQIKDLKD